MIKLIALDLDGTLLNSDALISSGNLKAIEYAKNKGAKITICSGRPYSSVKLFAEQIDTQIPVVCCNGVEVRNCYDGGILHSDYMNAEIGKSVVNISKNIGCNTNVYANDTVFSECENRVIKYYNKINKTLPLEKQCRTSIVDNLLDDVLEKKHVITKIEILDISDSIRDELKKCIHNVDLINTAGSWISSIEIMNHSASKGNGLRKLANILKIAPEEIMAIGDYNNDIEMLQFAGTSVAMGNADECVRAVAKHVTNSCDEDGVAEAIYKFI